MHGVKARKPPGRKTEDEDEETTTRDLPGPTEGEQAALAIVVLDQDACVRHLLPAKGDILIGRGADATLRIRQPWISRHHARLRLGENVAIELEDLGSAN